MTNRLHFSELTKDQVTCMWSKAVTACIKYAESINMSGLSDLPSHSIYKALEDALFNEWKQAKKVMGVEDSEDE